MRFECTAATPPESSAKVPLSRRAWADNSRCLSDAPTRRLLCDALQQNARYAIIAVVAAVIAEMIRAFADIDAVNDLYRPMRDIHLMPYH